MEKIDVTHTAKPDPQGRRLLLDPVTGRREWEDAPVPEGYFDGPPNPPCPPATVDAEIAKVAFANPALTGATEEYHAKKEKANFGMSLTDEKKFEDEAKPTKPAHKGRHKASEGDK